MPSGPGMGRLKVMMGSLTFSIRSSGLIHPGLLDCMGWEYHFWMVYDWLLYWLICCRGASVIGMPSAISR